MPYLLNAAYLVALMLATPWLLYQSLRKGKYREGFVPKFFGLVPRRDSDRTCVWFHAVSVGEVNLLASLLEEIAANRPDWECVISTTTMTGMRLAKKKYSHLTVFYCPLDFSWATRTAMARVAPDLLVLAELELWPNLIRCARASGAKVAVINGRLSEHSFRGYRRIRPLVRRLLGQVDRVAVQNEQYAERFTALGLRGEALVTTGSMKYDGAQTDRDNRATSDLRRLAGFHSDDLVLLAGSTQEPEEAVCLDTFRQLRTEHPRLRLILVPRHPDRFAAVAKLLEASGLPWQRRTDLDSHGPTPDARILLVDTVGELGAWWGTAEIAYVGGSMGSRGGQNMIEPAAYGAAVSFGPNTRNFRDIVATMLSRDAAVVVEDGESLTRFVSRCLTEPDYQSELGHKAQTLVAEQLGATRRTFRLLETLVADQRAATTPPGRAA